MHFPTQALDVTRWGGPFGCAMLIPSQSEGSYMPRRPRLDLPGVAQHIVQRGNDRQPCFFTDIDRMRYLQDLHELSLKLGIAVHAYVLMTNHVHLLLTSQQTGAASTLMQSLGRRYVRYINTTVAPATCGKAVTNRALYRRRSTCSAATATLN